MRQSQTVKGVPVSDRAPREVSWVDQGMKLLCKEVFHCRECGRLVSPFEKTCPGCGASSPVVVSVKPFLLPLAIGAAIVTALFLVL